MGDQNGKCLYLNRAQRRFWGVAEQDVPSFNWNTTVHPEDIEALFLILEDGNIDTYKDWKGRYKQNLDKMKSGKLNEIADVLKTLNFISSRKTLSFREKKMYERAKYLIVSEIAVINSLDEKEVERQVDKALARSASARMQSH